MNSSFLLAIGNSIAAAIEKKQKYTLNVSEDVKPTINPEAASPAAEAAPKRVIQPPADLAAPKRRVIAPPADLAQKRSIVPPADLLTRRVIRPPPDLAQQGKCIVNIACQCSFSSERNVYTISLTSLQKDYSYC